jgi:hypothetical protein
MDTCCYTNAQSTSDAEAKSNNSSFYHSSNDGNSDNESTDDHSELIHNESGSNDVTNKVIDINKYLTLEEKEKAKSIFYHCSNDPQNNEDRGLDLEQLATALSLLGHYEYISTIQQLLIDKQHQYSVNTINYDLFLELLATMRRNIISLENKDNSTEIVEAFNSLWESTGI